MIGNRYRTDTVDKIGDYVVAKFKMHLSHPPLNAMFSNQICHESSRLLLRISIGISSTVGFCFSSRLRVGEEVGRGAATFATLAGRNSYGVYLLSGLLSINGNKILIMSEMEMIVIRALFTSVSD